MLEKHSIKVSEGFIWSIIPAVSGTDLALEIRDKENRILHFSIVDCVQHHQNPIELPILNDWWSSLKAFNNHVLVLCRWEDPNNPASVTLWAFDYKNKKVLWEKSQFQFVGADEAGLWVTKVGGDLSTYFLLEWQSGEIIDQLDFVPKSSIRWVLPFHYTEQDQHFGTVQHFLLKHQNIKAVKACDYWESDGLIILSSYQEETKKLANFLLIMDLDGKIKLFEKLESDLKAIGINTFFIFENHLIFVRNRSELVSIPLKFLEA